MAGPLTIQVGPSVGIVWHLVELLEGVWVLRLWLEVEALHSKNVVTFSLLVKPVLNWTNCLVAEYTSDRSTNYNSFLN